MALCLGAIGWLLTLAVVLALIPLAALRGGMGVAAFAVLLLLRATRLKGAWLLALLLAEGTGGGVVVEALCFFTHEATIDEFFQFA